MTQLRPLLLSAVAFFVVLAAGGAFVNLAERRHADAHRHAVEEIGTAHAHLLERQFDRSLSSTFALASIIRQSGRIDDFDALAAEIIKSFRGINNLQLAPNGIVKQIYPLAGNEAAIGHNLVEDPRRQTEALAAIESRSLTLAGPFDLVQGGVAVAGRLPVFVPQSAGGERFWGFTIAMIHLDDLLEVSDLNRLVEWDYDYKLSRIDPASGLKTVFARSIDTDLQDPISFEIDVPNGTWTLAVAPRDGWPYSTSFPLEILSVVLASVAVGGLTYRLLRQPAILRRDVELRTRELAEANRRLKAEIEERVRAERMMLKQEEHLRLLLETTNAIPWEADAKSWQFTYVGPQAVKLLGYPLERWYEPNFWVSHLHPEDRDETVERCRTLSHKRSTYEMEFRMVAETGETVWLYDAVTVVGEPAKPQALRGVMIDVTESRLAQARLREREMLFHRLAQSVDQVFWFAELNPERVVYVSPAFERIWGCSAENLYRDPRLWIHSIHPEDRPRIRQAFEEWIEGKAPTFKVEYRIVRPDGSTRWIIDEGALIRDSEGGINSASGIAKDITHRKEIEEALRQLAGRLINAQEEERRRLARELHDDLTQRLAVLAIEAGKLEQHVQGAPDLVLGKLRQMKEQIVKLSADVHVISRQLHPSILDDLGLVSAMESECASFAQREGITVKYEPQSVPATLPRDVALCIYRVTQEALRNIAKHAQTKEAYVTLTGTDHGILLSIRDDGIGFDSAQLRGKAGLGLASMEERARQIHGDLSIQSQPGLGTVIEVRVPLRRGEE